MNNIGGKKYKEVAKLVEPMKVYTFEQACELICKTKTAKFDETIEISVTLGVDPRKADQNIRGAVPLPHGLGKNVRVAVFAKGEKVQEAKDAGADLVGGDDIAAEIQKGNINFDSVVATPDMMAVVGKIGKVLGPRGLMPSPKVGTVTFDVAKMVANLKAGMAEYKLDKSSIAHVSVGKASFGAEKIKENIESLFAAINKAKPQTSKGIYLKKASMCCTMGPGIRFDVTELRNI